MLQKWLVGLVTGCCLGGTTLLAQAPMATGTLEGRVVARENKQPLAGAKVTLTRSVTKETYTGETSKQGIFRLDGLPPGNYVVEVEAEGRTTVRLNSCKPLKVGRQPLSNALLNWKLSVRIRSFAAQCSTSTA